MKLEEFTRDSVPLSFPCQASYCLFTLVLSLGLRVSFSHRILQDLLHSYAHTAIVTLCYLDVNKLYIALIITMLTILLQQFLWRKRNLVIMDADHCSYMN